ncbi:hypothetical protein Tco_0636866 [Tanacetum coccineum]
MAWPEDDTGSVTSTANDVAYQVAYSPADWKVLRKIPRYIEGHHIKILLQQIGVIRGTLIPNYQEPGMTGPTSEPFTPLNRASGSNDNHDHSPSLQDQILNHISSLETLIKEHNAKSGAPITPIRLTFGDEEGGDKGKDKGKGPVEEVDGDLKKPYKEVLKSPFTRRIIEFSAPSHRMPTNLKIYDGSTDPDDHITRFVGAANQGEWEMPIYKDPTEVSKIVRRANETLPDFKERWTEEIGSRSDTNISFHEQLQMSRIGQTLCRSGSSDRSTLQGARPPRMMQGESLPKIDGYNSYNRRDHYQPYVSPRQPGRRYDNRRFENRRQEVNQLSLESLVKRPKEILATELQLQLPPYPPMIGTPKKENFDRYYDYHGEKGYYTNDCYQLKR